MTGKTNKDKEKLYIMSKNELFGASIQQYKTDIGFRTLVEGVNENLYVIPKYQRKYRWNREQVVSLVKSLIAGLPIPPIYTCRNDLNQLEILDGQQRIMSLFFYYIGYYLNNKKNSCIDFSKINIEGKTFKDALLSQFKLEKLHIEFEDENQKVINVDYDSLSKELKRKIDYTTITVIEIKIDDEKRKTQVLRQIFSNLNRGGTLLSNQEQRNGIYVCEFYDMLRSINEDNKFWRKIWGRENAKEDDLEALLRFCALKRYVKKRKKSSDFDFYIEGYKGLYAGLLDRFSDEAVKFTTSEIEEYKSSLENFFELFDVSGRVAGVTILESFFVVFEKMHVNKMITDKICNKILNNSEYKSVVRQGTVKMDNMNKRWKVVYAIWNGTD